MMEYEIDSSTKDKNYGVYDLLKLIEVEGYIKSLGVFSKEKYIFRTHIYDHRGTFDEIEEKIGEFPFYFSIDSKDYGYILYINTSHYVNPNTFIRESVIGVLNECIKFQKEVGLLIKIDITGLLFQDKKERNTYDISEVINDLDIELDYAKERILIKEVLKSATIKEEKISIFNIDKLISIFKKDKKKIK